jgi:bifunctional DNase/RNase
MTSILRFIFLALVAASASAENLEVESVEVRQSSVGPAVLLKIGKRAIPVIVDPIVAESIQGALTGRRPVRPLSHDLMHSMLKGFDGKVTQVVVTLHDGIFHAALTVVLGGKKQVFDSRSSDAIALAIHGGAPILVGRELLERAGIDLENAK